LCKTLKGIKGALLGHKIREFAALPGVLTTFLASNTHAMRQKVHVKHRKRQGAIQKGPKKCKLRVPHFSGERERHFKNNRAIN